MEAMTLAAGGTLPWKDVVYACLLLIVSPGLRRAGTFMVQQRGQSPAVPATEHQEAEPE